MSKVKQVTRWEDSSGRIWDSLEEAEYEEAALALQEALKRDGLHSGLQAYDAVQAIKINPEGYLHLLQNLVEAAERLDVKEESDESAHSATPSPFLAAAQPSDDESFLDDYTGLDDELLHMLGR